MCPFYQLDPIFIIYAILYSIISKFLWMSVKNYETFSMMSQWHHKVGHFAQFSRVMLQTTRFYVVFSSVSIEQGLGQIQYFMGVYKRIHHLWKYLSCPRPRSILTRAKTSTNPAKNMDFYIIYTKCNTFEVKYATNWGWHRKTDRHVMKRIVLRYKIDCCWLFLKHFLYCLKRGRFII